MKTALFLFLISQDPTIRIEGLDIITDSSAQIQAQIQALQTQVSQMRAELDSGEAQIQALQAQVSQMQAELDDVGSGNHVMLPCRESRIPRCDSVAPMIVRTSTHGHVTAYQDSEGFVRTCYFEPQDPN